LAELGAELLANHPGHYIGYSARCKTYNNANLSVWKIRLGTGRMHSEPEHYRNRKRPCHERPAPSQI
jgi:hypothetical protein